MAVNIEFRITYLVPIRGDTKVDRIDAEFPVAVERSEPQVGRNAEIIELRGMNEKWDTVDTQFRFARSRNDLNARRWANRFLERTLLRDNVRSEYCRGKDRLVCAAP